MTVETAQVAPWKIEEVEELTELVEESPVVAVADVEGIPAAQMQEMRASLRGQARIRVVKNTLLKRALDEADRDGVTGLADHVKGQTALITTDMNPFTLFKRLEEAKTRAPASGGETAPEDIVVEEGETPFSPGPVVGDLQNAGIPAAIDGGAVVVEQDEVVVEEGEDIPIDTAQMLTRLDIKPLTVGIDLRTAWEDGTVFDRSVLDVDEEAFLEDLETGSANAFGLAREVSYPTPETAPTLLSEAQGRALSLGLEAGLTEPGIVDRLLAQADGEAVSLASHLDEDALDEELRDRLGGAPAKPPAEPADDGGEEAEPEAEDAGDDAEQDEAGDDDDDEGGEEALGAMF